MNTERVLTTTTFQFTKEDYLIIHLFHRYIIVLDTLERFFHFIQFVVMRGE